MASQGRFLLVALDGKAFEAAAERRSKLPPEIGGTVVEMAQSVAEAAKLIHESPVLGLVIFPGTVAREVSEVLQAFLRATGGLPEFQGIVCDSPSPLLLAEVFDYGIDQFLPEGSWAEEAAALFARIRLQLDLAGSVERKIIDVARAIRRGHQDRISATIESLRADAAWDFRAAYALACGSEARGEFQQALDWFQGTERLCRNYRPAQTNIAQLQMIMGKFAEAVNVLQDIEKTSPQNFSCRAALACAYAELKDFAAAERFADAAERLYPGHSQVLEAKAQICFGTGRVSEAMALVDQMKEVGSYFAAKLNEVGIELSKAGDSKTAVHLYDKAHRVVRPEIRYKITMNAALACRKLQDYETALQLVSRCESEYGGVFSKLEKLKTVLMEERARLGSAA